MSHRGTLTGRSIAQSYVLEQQPAQSIVLSQAQPTQSVALSAPSQQAFILAEEVPIQQQAVASTHSIAVVQQASDNCDRGQAADNRWADYSPEDVDLGFPELPEPDFRCYQAPTVPPGQTRYLKVDEAAQLKNLEQNFNDVRTAVRENNTHLQRNRTQITNVNRNHNHLLRIVTNENNYEHNLTNKIVRVADIHRQKIENVKGETRNFKDFKQTQKVEAQGCRRADYVDNCPAPAAQAVSLRQATASVVQAVPALTQTQTRTIRSQVQ